MWSRLKWPVSTRRTRKESEDAPQSTDKTILQTPQPPTGTSSQSSLSNQLSPSRQSDNTSQSTVAASSRAVQQPRGTSCESSLRNQLFPDGHIDGLRVLHEPPNPIVDIIFIHGLTGNSFDTWFEEGSTTYWPKHLLSKDVPNARIMAFGYDADVMKVIKHVSTDNLRGYATNLLENLSAKRVKDKSV